MMARFLLLLIRGYRRFLSPILPDTCRYYPSCSKYAEEAVTRHGAMKGFAYSVGRVARCHPFNKGGEAPVPE